MPRPAAFDLSDPPVLGNPNFAALAQAFLGDLPGFADFLETYADWIEGGQYAELPDGSVASPSLRFLGDPDTGFYRIGANQIGLSEGGADRGRLYGRKNILGSVSQSGGVPTGAVIERGSNANGEYVKYADGTLECWKFITLTASISYDATWTFPVQFVGAPPVQLSLSGSFGDWSVPGDRAKVAFASSDTGDQSSVNNQSSRVLRVRPITGQSFTSGAIIEACSVRAVGRWF